MRRLFFIALSAMAFAFTAQAQTIKLPIGKKLQLIAESKSTVKVSTGMGEMEIPTVTTATSDVVVKSVTANGGTFTITLKNVKGTVNMMGQEQSFSSDDESFKSNPMAAEALKNLNKPEDIVVENGKTKDLKNAGSPVEMTNQNVAVQLLLPISNPANLKEGYKWTSTNSSDDSKSNTEYTVSKLSKDEVEITSASSVTYTGTKEQMGMQVKSNLSGTTSAISVYNLNTGLLKASAQKTDMSGTMNMMGNDAPLSMKATITITVQ